MAAGERQSSQRNHFIKKLASALTTNWPQTRGPKT